MKKLYARTILALLLSTTGTLADTADGSALIGQDWAGIVEAARGGEVNFFLWGGADTINRYVTEDIGTILKRDYDITLNRVGLTDTVEAVNIVLGEKEAGVTDTGTVDMIWINGENFRTMRQAGLAWCGYTDTLPNAALVNAANPAIANDFGVPVAGCEVPWNRAQFAFAYDSAKLTDPPRSIPALLDWIRANPGRFTYPAPPDFTGSVFVRHVFYHAAGGPYALLGPFDQTKYDAAAAKTWAILNDIEPYLWRAGKTYPTTVAQLNDLFANGEVDLTFNYDASQFGAAVDAGQYPATVRSYGLSDGTIGNTNYTLIPFNSPNKAAAMVLQNVLLSGEAQLRKADPAIWGAAAAIEVDRLPADQQADFAALPQHPSVISPQDLGKAALPELQADWISAIEKGWVENVGG
jgi:putative spermidine/putrescine transport system substrate-binding protein